MVIPSAVRRETQNAVMDREQLQEFVLHEANLFDERRFSDWMNLFSDDGYYWAPSRSDQESPLREVSLFYDDRSAMAARIQPVNHPNIHSQTPAPASVRLVSNFSIEAMDEDARACTVRSKFVMFEYRASVPKGENRVFAGTYQHRIVLKDGGFQLLWKKAVLTNADDRFGALFVYF